LPRRLSPELDRVRTLCGVGVLPDVPEIRLHAGEVLGLDDPRQETGVGDELLGCGGIGRAGEAAAGYGQGPQVLLEAAVHHDFADDQPIERGSGGGLAAERGSQGQNWQREADERSGHEDLQRVARLQVCHPEGRIVPDGASRFTAGVDRQTVFSLGSTESFRAAARTAAVFRLQRGRR
jgi:hypothetical protein